MNKLQAVFVALLTCISASAFSQNQYIAEAPGSIRFEQYTGTAGSIVFWRLPAPGSSLFPGGTCVNLSIPADKPEQSSRFMALYLFAKTNSKQIFYIYSPSCTIVSFGMDG